MRRKDGDERLGIVEAKDDVMRIQGTLNVWFQDRSYGFVHQEKGAVILKHFLHAANIKSGTPRTGVTVSFKSVVGRKGFLAVDAEILGDTQ
jgi:cold shock CspA family protein